MTKSTGSRLGKQVAKGGATTVILALLNERPMYGYELIRAIRDRSEGILDFSEGTVYPILYGLRDRGLVRSEAQESEEGRTRRVYHLTPEGKAALETYLRDWNRLAEGMRLALGT